MWLNTAFVLYITRYRFILSVVHEKDNVLRNGTVDDYVIQACTTKCSQSVEWGINIMAHNDTHGMTAKYIHHENHYVLIARSMQQNYRRCATCVLGQQQCYVTCVCPWKCLVCRSM